MIDSHCHLDMDEFASDRAAVLARALAAGVQEVVAIGGGAAPGTLDCGLRVARAAPAAGPRVWATAGIHPHEAKDATAGSLAELRALAQDPLAIAIGEIGLDYHYDHSPRERQRELFAAQLALAAELRLPVSIHCREAWDDGIRLITAARLPAAGVLHCFTGGLAEAQAVVALGFYLSFSGILTFPRSSGIREAAAWAPEDRLLAETDAPFLAPVPHRGRRNEPAHVMLTAARLAELRGWTVEQTDAITTANFRRLFAKTA
ncbi:MAG: TatD family hydrolase [Terriglobales bacterium]